jgi:pimeloyl-ACP methyl ester carboxylesterase
MRFALLSVLIGAAGAFGTGGALRTPAVPTGTAVVAQARDTGRVAVNGGTLYYETRGSGPAVVLLHGGGQDFTMWDSQMEPLAGAFRVTRYDARGHGRSTAPIGPYSMADDLRLVLDHIGADRAHLVGFSMGAGVALDFAVTHEARVLTLALISVTGPPPGAPIRPGAPPPLTEVAGRARLRALTVPRMLVVGEDDVPAVLAVAERVAAEVPGVPVVRVAGGAHLINRDVPEEFNRVLLRFLRKE